MYSYRLHRFTMFEVFVGLFAFFTMGFTAGLILEQLAHQQTVAVCREMP